MKIETRAVCSFEELDEVLDLACRIFTHSGIDTFTIRNSMQAYITTDPYYDLSQSRVLTVGGKIISHIRVIDRNVRIGAARVRIGGIRMVLTHPDYRGKGYLRILMDDALRYMERSAYDLSVLYGIPNFYSKFGFIGSLPEYRSSISADQLKDIRTTYTLKQAKPSDIPAFKRIYERNRRSQTLYIDRDMKIWRGMYERGKSALSPKYEIVSIRNKNGKVTGYLVYGGNDCKEVGFTDTQSANAILKDLHKRARASYQNEIILPFAPTNEFIRFCNRFDIKHSETHVVDGRGMIKIMNLTTLLKKMVPEFEERLKKSGFSSTTHSIHIVSKTESVTIVITKGSVSIVGDKKTQASTTLKLPSTELARLISGYRNIDELVDTKIKGNKALINALFPKTYPFIDMLDRF